MDTQYLTYKNKKALEDYVKLVNNFQKGEIVYLTDEDKFIMFDGEQFIDVPEKVSMKGEGLSMSLYELNKTIIAQLPTKDTVTDLADVRNTINDFRKKSGKQNFMLLCKDISYYTIFQYDGPKVCDFKSLGDAVTECAQDVGKIICGDLIPDGSAIEIWVRTPEEENLCMYLFNCEDLIVTYER